MSNISFTNRLGIHYFPDTQHYRERDLRKWQPELSEMDLSWLVLDTPIERAIPEYFLSGLIESNITPILHIQLPCNTRNSIDSLNILLKTYAGWGVRYICLFDRPNVRGAWPKRTWLSNDLVENFLDIFIPLANKVIEYDLYPIFPPLQPGGDYWDTTFLRLAMRSIQRRTGAKLLNKLVIGSYAWLNQHPLDWGAGGPETWPETRPYFTPPGSQDHMGFRIFDWYSAIINAEIGHTLPIIIMRTGEFAGSIVSQSDPPTRNSDEHAANTINIAQLFGENNGLNLQNQNAEDDSKQWGNHKPNSIPSEVISCNFWLLSANKGSPHANQAWYKPDGTRMQIANNFHYLRKKLSAKNTFSYKQLASGWMQNKAGTPSKNTITRRIRHYLLVPLYAWGMAAWDMETIRPYIQRYHPTIGFSLDEALTARKVTLVGNLDGLPRDALNQLHLAGCKVEHIQKDGTILAI